MDVVTIAILVVEILGFAGAGVVIHRMKQNVDALCGTVKAQAETLKAVGELNRIALEMAKAFDPKKFADAATAYQVLVDKNANAAVEDVRRTLQREHEKTQEQATRDLDSQARQFDAVLRMGFALLAYIPPTIRDEAITRAEMPSASKTLEKNLKAWFSGLAKAAPDLSLSNPGLREAFYRAALGEALRIVDPKRGDMDVKP
jgi:hypothetical protein